MKSLIVGIVMMMLIALPVSALLTENVDDVKAPSFFQKIISLFKTTQQNVIGQTEVVAGATLNAGEANSFKNVIEGVPLAINPRANNNPCYATSYDKIFFDWEFTAIYGDTSKPITIISYDKTPRGRISYNGYSVWYGAVSLKFPAVTRDTDYELVSTATCEGKRKVDTMVIRVKAGQVQPTNNCGKWKQGDTICADDYSISKCELVSSEFNILGWGASKVCAAGGKCVMNAAQTVASCKSIPPPQTCRFNPKPTQQECDSIQRRVPNGCNAFDGTDCQRARNACEDVGDCIDMKQTCDAVFWSVQDGECISKSGCSGDFSSQADCEASIKRDEGCTNQPSKPCADAFWDDYPLCEWDESNCQDAARPCADVPCDLAKNKLNINTCSCTLLPECSTNSDCGIGEYCNTAGATAVCKTNPITNPPPPEDELISPTLTLVIVLLIVFAGAGFVLVMVTRKRGGKRR